MAVVDIIEFLLMALEVTGKFKGKNFHLQKKDESFTWRSSYSWSYVYFLQCETLSHSHLGTFGHKKMGLFGLKSDPLLPIKNWDI